MTRWFKGLFSESGDVSMLRVMSLIVCITACYSAIAKGPDDLGVVTILLTSAFGAKVGQKIVEGRGNVDRKQD